MNKDEAILIVDDDAETRHALSRSLRPLGRPVVTQENGFDALLWLRGHPACLVISDHHMPKMDGIAFLTRVKADYPGVRRLMLTGSGSLDLALHAIDRDLIERYITKPWNLMKLRHTIEQLLPLPEGEPEPELSSEAEERAGSPGLRPQSGATGG